MFNHHKYDFNNFYIYYDFIMFNHHINDFNNFYIYNHIINLILNLPYYSIILKFNTKSFYNNLKYLFSLNSIDLTYFTSFFKIDLGLL